MAAPNEDPRALSHAVATVIDAVAPALDAPTRAALGAYVALLARHGHHTDLVGAHTPEAFAEVALVDALVLARDATRCRAPSWEIGAGGASLSVPLGLLVPALTGRLVEPRQKRATFLRLAIGSLGLAKRFTVEQVRAEPEAPPAGIANLALGRAVFKPSVWIPMAHTVVSPGGAFAVLSTEPLAHEDCAGLTAAAVEHYALPFAKASRVVTWFDRPRA